MIKDKFPIPTGYLFTGEYSKGLLETLSIGDYGKSHNVKADFLGFTKPIEGVSNTQCMPLSEKWVITLSTMYGCPMKCTFCDAHNVEFKGNVTFDDLKAQFYNALSLFPNVGYTERMNIHFARMGEPVLNEAVFEFTRFLAFGKHRIQSETGVRMEVIHPVLTTSLPRKFKKFERRIHQWCSYKNNEFNGQAGLQFSINSTNEEQRQEMFGGMSLDLESFSELARKLPEPIARKYCLNFAYSTDFEIDARKLRRLFDPEKFMVKITPIHNNNACRENGIETIGGYETYAPYLKPEEDLKNEGFDVLVFVPSMDEEDGLVTCGNAILGGGKLKETESVVNIRGQSE
jgi:23S rRNA (adenine2503-C2)-methyltransferase